MDLQQQQKAKFDILCGELLNLPQWDIVKYVKNEQLIQESAPVVCYAGKIHEISYKNSVLTLTRGWDSITLGFLYEFNTTQDFVAKQALDVTEKILKILQKNV